MTARPQGRRPDQARRAHVVALLEPVVSAAGFDLEDVELRSVGRRLLVRVLVDADNGITLDDVAEVSQVVSDALDSDDALGDEPYTLEVSSPGVDRPLTEPRHWRRNVGRLVALTLTDRSQLTARLVAVSDDATSIELETDTKGRKARRTVALADVAKAVVEVEFSRGAAAGSDADITDGDMADDDTADDDTADDDTADDDTADGLEGED